MTEVCLTFFTSEFQKHKGILLYEWLLEKARKLGLPGGSAVRAIAGFGRHHMHEEHFFELAGNVPVEISFIVSEKEAMELLKFIKKEKINLFYVKFPVMHGFTA